MTLYDKHLAADDLAWLAFRYAAGEFTEAEADAFESRLDTDQSAREAVARAVALVSTLLAADADRHRLRSRPFAAPARYLGVILAAAACLTLAIYLPWSSPAPVVVVDRIEPSSGSVALTWSGLRQETADDDHPDLVATLDDRAADLDETAESDESPPAWLLEATSLGETSPGL